MVIKKHPPGKGKNRDQYNGRSIRVAASGTLIGASSTTVAAGDTTLILTVSSGIWLPADAGFDDQRQGILDGITGDDDFATVIAATAVTDVVRTSNTVVTITFPSSAYSPSAAETVSVAIPAAAFYLTDTPRITTRTPSNTPVSITVPTPGSEGPLYPGTIAEAADGQSGWSNLANLAADDASVASIAFSGGGVAHTVQLSNFGFEIPSEATITGVEVAVERRKTDSGNVIAIAAQIENTSLTSDNKAEGAGAGETLWTTSFYEMVYGGNGDLWGLELTPAIINASDFRFDYRIRRLSGTGSAEADYVRVTVYYTT